MNIKLKIELDNSILDIKYRSSIVSFFKKSVQEYDENIYNNFYDKTLNKSKSYTFSIILANPKFNKEEVKVENNIMYIYFSTWKYEDLLIFYNSFLGQLNKKFSIYRNSFTLKEITFLRTNEIFSKDIIVKFLSPVIVRSHDKENNKDWYVGYDEDDFQEKLKQNISNSILNNNLIIDTTDFEIIPIKPKKVVVKLYNKNVQANAGIYQIKGNLELLNFLMLSGIGSQRNSGFGYFKIIG
ncbi:MAG: CRISPR-associated endoribonuclease Cas6 [Clostridia bacterium]